MPWTPAQLLAAVTPMISLDEGCRLESYQDTEGYWTIGWGRHDGNVQPGQTCTQEEADGWREAELWDTILGLQHRIPWINTLSIPRAAVIVDMAYELGIGGLMDFKKFLFHLYNQNVPLAVAEMLDSKWAKQVPLRAHRLASQMLRDALT